MAPAASVPLHGANQHIRKARWEREKSATKHRNSLVVSIDFGTLFTILFRKAHYSHLDDLLGRSLFRGLHVGGRWRRTC